MLEEWRRDMRRRTCSARGRARRWSRALEAVLAPPPGRGRGLRRGLAGVYACSGGLVDPCGRRAAATATARSHPAAERFNLFDPDDIVVPMLKFRSDPSEGSGLWAGRRCLRLVCARTVAIRPGGRDIDYTVGPDALTLGAWRFDLSHQPAGKVLEPLEQLIAIHQISRRPSGGTRRDLASRARGLRGVQPPAPDGPRDGVRVLRGPAAAICPLVGNPGYWR